MDNLRNNITDEAVQGLLNFTSEIFDSFLVRDIETRKQVCRQLLADSSFIEYAGAKFDLNDALNNGGIIGRNTDPLDVAKPTVTVNGGLSGAQKSILINNNMDYTIKFNEVNSVPHRMAYAQRMIDTARCKASVNYRKGVVIDIGGNYATHAMNGAMRIHSCTLKDSVEEMHRQTQRDVNLELGDFDMPSMCTQGVENCDVFATEFFSLHTLPRMDPQIIPAIFDRHGFEFGTGVHHYDKSMDTLDQGFMPDIDMHWKVKNGDVQFFFENDSSYDYSHRLDWLKTYSHVNFFNDPKFSFVVYYTVERLEFGNLYWNMVRLDKATLGSQIIQPQYRYYADEEALTIQVPVFDQESVFPISDPRAYKLQTIAMPTELFSYVYKAGISNDTNRPDLPISLDAVRDLTHTFNYTRKVNGTSTTIVERLSSEHVDLIATGIYLVIVQRAAQLKAVSTQYTKMFLRMQKRWGDESFSWLLVKCFSKAAILPYILLAENFSQVTDLMAVHMRSVVKSTKVLASVTEELPYYLISPVYQVPGTASTSFVRPVSDVQSTADVGSDDVNIEQFYENFKDQLQPEHAERILTKIRQQRERAEKQVLDALQESEIPQVEQTRDSWQEAIEFLAEKVQPDPVTDMHVVSRDEVLEQARLRIYEAGLYNYDVALNVVANATERCSETWTGTMYKDVSVTSKNNTTDLGIKYLRVVDGVVQNTQEAEQYTVALDPNTHELLYMPERGHEMKLPTNCDYVFVFSAFKIFNNFKLGAKLIEFSRFSEKTKKYSMVLVDGVPGCGKTYEIVKKFKTNDLIACAVRETANRTRERVLKEMPKADPKRIRSADSAVMHGVPRTGVLRLDEGLMLLPGVADFLAQSSRAEKVEVYGDSAQIGFIDRGSKLGLLRFPKMTLWEAIEYRNESFRIPADICCLIKRFYPPERRPLIKTFSPIRRSVTMRYVPEVEDACYTVAEPNVMVMTLTTMDKEKIAVRPGFYDPKRAENEEGRVNKSATMTIHEAQGTDVPHASIMRLTTFENPIFNSVAHQLVAFTRHTHTLHLYSTVLEDPYLLLAKAAIEVTEEEIDACMLPTPDTLTQKYDNAKPRGTVVSQFSATVEDHESD